MYLYNSSNNDNTAFLRASSAGPGAPAPPAPAPHSALPAADGAGGSASRRDTYLCLIKEIHRVE